MSLKKLESAVAKIEGKKHQASIGDIREIIAIIVRLCGADKELRKDLYAAIMKHRKNLKCKKEKSSED